MAGGFAGHGQTGCRESCDIILVLRSLWPSGGVCRLGRNYLSTVTLCSAVLRRLLFVVSSRQPLTLLLFTPGG